MGAIGFLKVDIKVPDNDQRTPISDKLFQKSTKFIKELVSNGLRAIDVAYNNAGRFDINPSTDNLKGSALMLRSNSTGFPAIPVHDGHPTSPDITIHGLPSNNDVTLCPRYRQYGIAIGDSPAKDKILVIRMPAFRHR
jgi:hypothetical protein